MALKKVKGNLERMFDKNLSDLVRGIRNNKDNEAKYIAQCMEEIKVELRQDNMTVKANAVAKLAYLQMMGYDISWAGFNIIEVMSSPKFTLKRIGYLAASQCFHADLELLMLTTNMIRKDLSSQNQYEAGVALSALACFVSPDLGRDLSNDIMTLLSSTKPYLRKKGVLVLYKIFLTYPDALRPAFPRLKEKLEDPDPGVQSAAVNVICELARKNPKNYLSLAPIFFKLMTTSTNNWMLIKIIKLFAEMTLIQPEIGRELAKPIITLIQSTSAMSLLYECINTVIAVLISISTGMPNHNASIQLCVQKLRILIEDSDQNLKYLGLLAMSKILATHPKSVQTHKDLVMRCLDDKDESIRLRALDLLYGMVGKKNLMEIVKKLMVHMQKAEGTTYRDELLCKIIQICSQNNYQHISNFEWYISVLVELARVEGLSHGELVASQMLDVAVRVQTIRPFAVQQMSLLIENSFIIFGFTGGTNRPPNMIQVLYAAAWICGEYIEFLPSPISTLSSLLDPKVTQLPANIQSVYLHNALKMISYLLSKSEVNNSHVGNLLSENGEPENEMEIKNNQNGLSVNIDLNEIQEKVKSFLSSDELEVQERAGTLNCFIKCYLKIENKGEENDLLQISNELQSAFMGELNPVAPKAQKKVPIPEGLDLDSWINDPPSESEEEEVKTDVFVKSVSANEFSSFEQKSSYQPTDEELAVQRESRRYEQEMNPHYLKDTPRTPVKSPGLNGAGDVPPVEAVELDIPLNIPSFASSEKYLREVKTKKDRESKKSRKGKKKKKNKQSSDEEVPEEILHVVSTAIEMPEGATISDTEECTLPEDDPHRALNIDLDSPMYDVSQRAASRSSKVSGDGDRVGLIVTNTNTTMTEKSKSSESKHKLHKKHKKEKSSKSKKKKETAVPEINLLIEDSDNVHLQQNGTEGYEVPPNSDKPLNETLGSTPVKSVETNYLEELDPIKSDSVPRNETESAVSTASGILPEEFAELLSSGNLICKKRIEVPDLPLKKVISKLVRKCKSAIVEESNGCSSLYRKTSKGQSICILVKEKAKTIVIDVKSDSEDSLKRISKDINKAFDLSSS